MHRTVVLNVVGLTPDLLGLHTPRLSSWMAQGQMATINAALPAVTTTAQTAYLTGQTPHVTGIVGNGWYDRNDCEVKFWKQANTLVQAPKVWDAARALDPSFTCANLFWWYNMYSSVDYSVTPRPLYPADGRKLPDIYTAPAALRDELQGALGQFPLFKFWGPGADITCSRWIAEAARRVEQKYSPTLSLVYLPHLDYNLQRLGPRHPKIASDLAEIDAVCGDLITFFEERGAQVILLSEYGITEVSRPVHINRALRGAGLLTVRDEVGRETLDAGASKAFAVADHQIAHVYVNDDKVREHVRELLAHLAGVERVLEGDSRRAAGLDHPRAGDFMCVSDARSWFTYYFWQDDAKAPDYARTVDIHRKPGYDPAELFLDPAQKAIKAKIGATLLKKQLGFRYLMEVVPLDAALVKGSHGRPTDTPNAGPLIATRQGHLLPSDTLDATDVYAVLLSHLTGTPA